MGSLRCWLLWVLPQVWGNSKVLESGLPFRILQISSFVNSSWQRTDCSAWLGDLQTHRWDNASDAVEFLKPWARGKLSHQELEELQQIYRVYRSSFTRDIWEFGKMLQFDYPADIQASAGCDVYPGNASKSFLQVAYEGKYIVGFQESSWEAAPDAPAWVKLVIKVLNEDQGTKETVQKLLKDCPHQVRGLLETGKSELEQQVKPKAWLSSGPSAGPGHQQLVCHVSGFYPKPVWVMWMRGEQEQPDTQHSDVMPSADETWYLRATLDVAAEGVADLACRVKHSSLEGQDIVLHWDISHTSVTSIVLAVLAFLVLLGVLLGLILWFRRHRLYQDIL
ncbi:antigen-presenting glycoprotein CD1d-like isoform X2 [Perognathus longimembris pacificus]|uniref:antigen-presenting glycoprotein CD1d-like isoform X2 n=1 Tax=Perognathus longimembris pacificus TaxID=214514 RepID=UPI00201999D1|nr:antigen-presenting glycoprotein CD1d-like isoform X2 [Perognathus longimembris pacificus]